MRFGLGRLRLSSSAFWALTPRELNAAVMAHAPPGVAPLSRGALDRLILRFPDKPER